MSVFGGGNYGYGGYRTSRGGGFRWIIALVIAAIGIITYLTHTEVNPVTGEKQHIAMTVEQERALGLEAAPEMAAKMGGEVDPRSDPRAAFVAQVGAQIVQRSDASRSNYADNFHYHLLSDANTINAFALPGGQIFITRALFDRLQTEAQLAGVLGHETGHVVARHSAEQMAKGELGQSLSTAFAIGSSDGSNRGQMAALAGMMANQMLQLHYSRDDELQADALGLKYMIQTGYDPSAMLAVMETLKSAARGGRQPQIFSTHPDPDARIAQIREFLQRNYPNGVSQELAQGRSLQK
jgi:predicted Zn-dependent protease